MATEGDLVAQCVDAAIEIFPIIMRQGVLGFWVVRREVVCLNGFY